MSLIDVEEINELNIHKILETGCKMLKPSCVRIALESPQIDVSISNNYAIKLIRTDCRKRCSDTGIKIGLMIASHRTFSFDNDILAYLLMENIQLLMSILAERPMASIPISAVQSLFNKACSSMTLGIAVMCFDHPDLQVSLNNNGILRNLYYYEGLTHPEWDVLFDLITSHKSFVGSYDNYSIVRFFEDKDLTCFQILVAKSGIISDPDAFNSLMEYALQSNDERLIDVMCSFIHSFELPPNCCRLGRSGKLIRVDTRMLSKLAKDLTSILPETENNEVKNGDSPKSCETKDNNVGNKNARNEDAPKSPSIENNDVKNQDKLELSKTNNDVLIVKNQEELEQSTEMEIDNGNNVHDDICNDDICNDNDAQIGSDCLGVFQKRFERR